MLLYVEPYLPKVEELLGINIPQLLLRTLPTPHRDYQRNWQFLSFLTIKLLNPCQAKVTGVVGQDTTIYIVFKLGEEHGCCRGAPGYLPHWLCRRKIKARLKFCCVLDPKTFSPLLC